MFQNNVLHNSHHSSIHSLSSDDGTNDYKHSSTTNGSGESPTYEQPYRIVDDDSYHIKIYRYKFTNEFVEKILYTFSKIHQYDTRKEFKEAWNQWTEDNSEYIQREINRLTSIGFQGNILDKMFKSARYYFREKKDKLKQNTKNRCYKNSSKKMLESMDQHIKKILFSDSSIHHRSTKPSEAFLDFCNFSQDLLKEEIANLISSGYKEKTEIQNKIKKTYKNRYFIFIQQITK